jgi:hypothetical protein
LSNERVSEEAILAGHFHATRDRFLAEPEPILVLHDTTEFSFKRAALGPIGMLHKGVVGKDHQGRLKHHTSCGLLMHSSLAVTTDGLPLGLAAVKFWTRKKFKGTNALKRKVNPTRVPIEEKESVRWLENLRQSTALFDEPQRCVHIGDRESDIYELFCTAQEVGTHFLVRTCVDRLAGQGECTVAEEMQAVRVKGRHRLKVKNNQGDWVEAVLELRYRRIRVLPPIGKQKHYPDLMLTVLYAQERDTPKDREKIDTEIDHRSTGALTSRGHREVGMVRVALENRGLPQDPQIGLQSRRIQTAHGGAAGEITVGLLPAGLAHFLADHDESLCRRCTPRTRPDQG